MVVHLLVNCKVMRVGDLGLPTFIIWVLMLGDEQKYRIGYFVVMRAVLFMACDILKMLN